MEGFEKHKHCKTGFQTELEVSPVTTPKQVHEDVDNIEQENMKQDEGEILSWKNVTPENF